MTQIAVEHLKGLDGEEWEQALTITRTRDRGPIRVVNDPMNVMLILRFKPEINVGSNLELKRKLKQAYNMDATNKSIKYARTALRLEADRTLIRKIVEQGKEFDFGSCVRINDLLMNDLRWASSEVGSRLWVIADALDKLGYKRKRYADWALWEK